MVLAFLSLFCQKVSLDFDSARNLVHGIVVKEVKKESTCEEIRDSANDHLSFP